MRLTKVLVILSAICMMAALSSCNKPVIGAAQTVVASEQPLPDPDSMVCTQYIAMDGGSLLLYQPESNSAGSGVIYEWADDGAIRKLTIDISLRSMVKHNNGALLCDEDFKIWLLESNGDSYTISQLNMPYKESVYIAAYNGNENIIVTKKWKAYRFCDDEIMQIPVTENITSVYTNAFTERIILRKNQGNCYLYLPDGSYCIIDLLMDIPDTKVVINADAQYVGTQKGVFEVSDAGIASPFLIDGEQIQKDRFAGAGNYALFMNNDQDIYLQKDGELQKCEFVETIPYDLSVHNTAVFQMNTYYPDREIKYAIWQVYTKKGVGIYSDNTAAERRIRSVYLIDLTTGTIIARHSETGGPPSEYVGPTGGSRVGSAPKGMTIPELFDMYFKTI